MAIFAYTETAASRLNSGTDLTAQQVAWTALDAFLVWRVWRGGRMAWGVLLVINLIVLAQMLFGGWTAYASALWVFVIAQTLILLAVRHQAAAQ